MRTLGNVLAILALGLALAAPAVAAKPDHNRYKWKDAQGNLHYDDALPTEALQFGYEVVNPRGLVIKHVDRAKTMEELHADAAASAKAAEQKHADDAQAQNDQQLLAAYPSEQALVSSQQAQLDMIDQNVHATQLSLENQEQSLTQMLSHAADLDRTGKPIPATLKAQIEALRRNVEQQKTYIANKETEKAGLAQKFADAIAHYRSVQTKAQAHSQP